MTTPKTINKSITKESLFSIGEHFFILESIIIDNDGEIDEIIDQWLEEYQAKEEEKIDAYCYLIQKFEEITLEAKRLAERSGSYSKKVKDLKDRLKIYLENRGRDKIETPRFTVSVSNNGGQLPIRLHEDIQVDQLPDQFIHVYKQPNLSAIRDAILSGDEQAMEVATILPRGTHLRIK